eukprot:8794262-Pyramimonas_sp.AAC.1
MSATVSGGSQAARGAAPSIHARSTNRYSRKVLPWSEPPSDHRIAVLVGVRGRELGLGEHPLRRLEHRQLLASVLDDRRAPR